MSQDVQNPREIWGFAFLMSGLFRSARKMPLPRQSKPLGSCGGMSTAAPLGVTGEGHAERVELGGFVQCHGDTARGSRGRGSGDELFAELSPENGET